MERVSGNKEKVWVQITSGRGPEECAWVVFRVVEEIQQDALSFGLVATLVDRELGAKKETMLSALLEIAGKNVEEFVASWSGTLQWIGRSPYRSHHKRKNWFVGVIPISPPSDTLSVDEKDLEIEMYRGGGPGGQHRNKVSTAIRVTHKPTGLVVRAEEERSQTANRRKALVRLQQALKARGELEEREVAKERWSQHNALERGNPVRIYRGSDFRKK